MVFKEQVDLKRERPLQGGVGADIWKLKVNRCRRYRRILSMVVANIVKGWLFFDTFLA